MQIQEVMAGLDVGALVFVGHCKQNVIFDAPSVAEYVVTGHARHTVAIVAFVVVEYVPAVQLVHAMLPVVVL